MLKEPTWQDSSRWQTQWWTRGWYKLTFMTTDRTASEGLMSRRIRKILLVCNSYDSFSLEEDGHIEYKITREYSELNLSNPPSIERAETPMEALVKLSAGDNYDLIITMYNLGKVDVFDFAAQTKAISPSTPIVLLCSFSKEIYRRIGQREASLIDYVFCWDNNTDVIIAIIKLLEDSLNAEHDILEMGARAILLIEDSVRYYSTYLPILYKLVLQQNNEAIRDTLNEEQQIQRKRSRPKILLATCYEDALSLYRRYSDHLLGVISDIGFVIHRGDRPDKEKIDAGLKLCRLVHSEDPTLPFLMQSSQESMRERAEELGAGFILKTSKTLTHELSEYICRCFGFGDFLVPAPLTGAVITKGRDLHDFEEIMKTIPDKSLIDLCERNYISRWLYARGFFSLADHFRKLSTNDFSDVESIRKTNIGLIHDFRVNQGIGVIARFDDETYNDTIRFARLGDGSLGGKARGLAFLNHILHKYNLYDKWEDVRITVPRTIVITTDWFDRFIVENGLQYVISSDISDAEILSEFVASTLPTELTDSLRVFIRTVHNPLAIRSSSKLEDSYYQPFAGVYSTYMIPRTENEDQQLRLLSKAIKSVYASIYFSASRGYILSTANVISEEKMAVVIQEICGKEECGYWFPTASGVARSVNFYPVGNEKPEDGIVKLAYGLGKAVVDGDTVLRFSPKYPRNILQTSTPELTINGTQSAMLALNLKPETFKTSVDEAVNIERIPIGECGRFSSLKQVVSTWDAENMRMVDSAAPAGPKYVTFARMLKYRSFPLADIIDNLLGIMKNEVNCDIEIEFAAEPSGEPASFSILQIRPISIDGMYSEVDWAKVDENGSFLISGCAIGPGFIPGIRDIVYLREENFDKMRTREMAAELTALNARMRKENRNYILIGYGRWGSSVESLGVPVKWSDISEAKVIVECSLDDFRVEPSQGTHFFQNMTSANAGYINVNSFARSGEKCETARFDSLPAVYESHFLRQVRLSEDIFTVVDGKSNRAVLKIE
ncbi:MAG: PEP/pyruvate-binding domain-containing protein [Candidatus Cryptobacteroides sp.]